MKVTIMSNVKRVDRSPMNASRWVLSLACGHEVWVTSKRKPQRMTQPCSECTRDRAADDESEETRAEIEVGDTVRRPDGELGRVVEIAERPSRKTDTGQRVTVERRIRVQWSERRTWLAVSGEGTRWSRVAATEGSEE